MREIKFRAWDKDFQKMFKCTRITYKGKRTLAWRKPFRGEGVSWCEAGWYVGKECYLMQYTGLKDKNGKEIYEGDILYFTPYETNTNNRIVKFKDGQFVGELIRNNHCAPLKSVFDGTEIIGNIYENPELLEDTQ